MSSLTFESLRRETGTSQLSLRSTCSPFKADKERYLTLSSVTPFMSLAPSKALLQCVDFELHRACFASHSLAFWPQKARSLRTGSCSHAAGCRPRAAYDSWQFN